MLRMLTVMAALLFGPALQAADWAVEHARSEIKFSGTHAGNGFEGTFKRWSAEIAFDQNDLESSKVRVIIETASAETGNGLYDGTLKGDDWFDTANHPEAIFEASSFKHLSEGNYLAEGTLIIRGKSLPFVFEFDLTIDSGAASMSAKQSLDRIAFGLGGNSDANAAWVSREIGLAISVEANVR